VGLTGTSKCDVFLRLWGFVWVFWISFANYANRFLNTNYISCGRSNCVRNSAVWRPDCRACIGYHLQLFLHRLVTRNDKASTRNSNTNPCNRTLLSEIFKRNPEKKRILVNQIELVFNFGLIKHSLIKIDYQLK